MVVVVVVDLGLGVTVHLRRTADYRRRMYEEHRKLCRELIAKAGGFLPPTTRLSDEDFFAVYAKRGPSTLRGNPYSTRGLARST
jgi:hypothetical protein